VDHQFGARGAETKRKEIDMDLLKTMLSAAGSGGLEQLGGQFGLDSGSVEKVLGQVVPALGRGLQKNTRSTGGLDSLLGALKGGQHQRYLDEPAAAVSRAGIEEGNGILGHILGSKDVSRNVAAHASSASGVTPDVIKKMLPMIATMAMGALSKQTNSGASLAAQDGGQSRQPGWSPQTSVPNTTPSTGVISM
jgi:hypothetical protein